MAKTAKRIFYEYVQKHQKEFQDDQSAMLTKFLKMAAKKHPEHKWGRGKIRTYVSEFKNGSVPRDEDIRPISLENVTELSLQEKKKKEEKKLFKEAIEKITELEKEQDIIMQFSKHYHRDLSIQDTVDTGKSEAIAVGVFSDLHVEERIERRVMNGMNEYNPDLAIERSKNFFSRFVKLVKKEQEDVKIDTVVLALLGDNITGFIHEELKETNFMTPMEATLFASDILYNGLKYTADRLSGEGIKKIIIPQCCGNHGRSTRRKQFKNGIRSSYEWLMYNFLNRALEKLPGSDIFEFHVAEAEWVYVKLYDKVARFGHGDHFRYGGGVGGLTVPLIKHLHRIDQQILAHYTFYGHWHQAIKPVSNCIINGSVIGFNEYAAGMGLKPEPPIQQFQLIDRDRGMTVNIPIIL